ncbi:hypothetical protein HHK36_008640 [Tetracentron sinense]|uniref:HVA22-like protein n=1 Tax=Tetracentron sinense TaxID=13715 RepID=A0A834ZQI0_TETSI|nr:hypothetical protein HHK36_008640 [Tetracentron sinense]
MCIVVFAGGEDYEVMEGITKFVVNLHAKSCAYQAWEISGLPCKHAAACIARKRANLEEYCDEYYSKETYLRAHGGIIHPIFDENMWLPGNHEPVEPPSLRRLPGRPKKNRRRELDELAPGSQSRERQTLVKCRTPNFQLAHVKRIKMMGSFLTRGLAMVFGYAYPAYECYKTVEKNKPEIEQLRFWCQYWILVAVLTVCERVGDTFISWVPMYSEAKVAFFIYLWYPKTKGTTYVYDSFFRPYLSKHETEIDRNLLELRTRAGDIAVLYWEKAANYGQTRVFEILQYFASQSTSRPRPAQVSIDQDK